MMKKLFIIFIIFLLSGCREQDEVVSLFPLENYSQKISDWIHPHDPDFDKPIIDSQSQRQRLSQFYDHFFGSKSPWNADYVSKILRAQNPNDLLTNEKELIDLFSNKNKPLKEIYYEENFRSHPDNIINEITANINLSELNNIKYNPIHRGITIDNLQVRALPTEQVFFYHHKIAGQGYPFDNLQISSLWAGSPVYILSETRDHAWSLVLTQDYIGWVKSNGIARTSNTFIMNWMNAALKNFVAITQTKTSIIDKNGIFRFSAYVGSVFPGKATSNGYKIMIPVANAKQDAEVHYAFITKDQATSMPFSATPHHFTQIMQTLIGRPYGWGNLYFYNDCSAELKNLFVPFGIWLPRHSSEQIYAGRVEDMTKESAQNRIDYLMEKGRPFTTIVYIGSHIFMYAGSYPNPNSKDHELIPLTYQNMWGLSPNPANRRAIVGKSVLFPLLENYPEDARLVSHANKKYFRVSYLDETPNYLMKLQIIDLKELMFP